MKPDKDKTQKLCLRQQTQICGVNILYWKIWQGSVLIFVSMTFRLIPEVGCGQNPTKPCKYWKFWQYPMLKILRKIEFQRHKINYALYGNLNANSFAYKVKDPVLLRGLK